MAPERKALGVQALILGLPKGLTKVNCLFPEEERVEETRKHSLEEAVQAWGGHQGGGHQGG